MDWFGIKKRRALREAIQKAKESAQQEKKRIEELKFATIKKEWLILKDRAEKERTRKHEQERQLEEDVNSKCPKCKSKNVNDRIQRFEGEFKSTISGGFSSSLFGGSGSVYGHGHGKIDTNEVNKCNDCGHEWKKYERKYFWLSEIFDSEFNSLRYILNKFAEANSATIKAGDLNETFTSVEEKRTELLKRARSDWNYWNKDTKEFFKDISIETIHQIIGKEVLQFDSCYERWFRESWNEEIAINELGFNHLKL